MARMPATHVQTEPALPRPAAGPETPGAALRRLAGLSVVLPCRDAESGIAAAIRSLAAGAARASGEYEIVVVDDGSRDATAGRVAAFVDASGPVRLLVHPHPRGYGAAMRTGLGAARMPWVLLASAEEALDDIPGFAAVTGSADLVAGRRVSHDEPVSRRVAEAAWNRLMRALFRLPVHDVDCPFKLVRRDVLTGIELRSAGPVVAAELVIRCRAAGARVAEYEFAQHPLGRPGRVRAGAVLRALGETLRRQSELRRISNTSAACT
jgi:glycosyltransferase involved in cell wall biosynthesis